jgi:hypothetical protein
MPLNNTATEKAIFAERSPFGERLQPMKTVKIARLGNCMECSEKYVAF